MQIVQHDVDACMPTEKQTAACDSITCVLSLLAKLSCRPVIDSQCQGRLGLASDDVPAAGQPAYLGLSF